MAVTIHSLVYRTICDAAQFREGAVLTRSEQSATRKLFAESRTDVEKYGMSMDALTKLHRKGGLDAEAYRRSMEKLNAEFKNTSINKDLTGTGTLLAGQVPGISSFTSALKTIGPIGAAAVVGIGGITLGVDLLKTAFSSVAAATAEAMERIDDTRDFSTRVGISTEAIAGFRLAAEQAGVSSEAFDNDLEKMLKNIGAASRSGGEAAEKFEQLGLNVDKLASQRADKTFLEIADAISKIEDPYERAIVAQDIFGKSGQDLNTVLREGAKAFRDGEKEAEAFGLAINAVDSKSVADANDELAKVAMLAKGAANEIAVELAPTIRDLSKEVTQLAKDFGGVRTAVSDFVSFAKQDVGGLLEYLKTIHPEFEVLGKLAKKSFEFGRGLAGGEEQDKQSEAERERTRRLDEEIAKRQEAMSKDQRFGTKERAEEEERAEELKRSREERQEREAAEKESQAKTKSDKQKADKLREQIEKDAKGSSDPFINSLIEERRKQTEEQLAKLGIAPELRPGQTKRVESDEGVEIFGAAGDDSLPERDIKAEAAALADRARATAEAQQAAMVDPAKVAAAVDHIRAGDDPAAQARATARREGIDLDDAGMKEKGIEIAERIRAGLTEGGKSAADKIRETLQKNLEQQVPPKQLDPEIEKKLRKRTMAGASEEELREQRKELEDDADEKFWDKFEAEQDKQLDKDIREKERLAKQVDTIRERSMTPEDKLRKKFQDDVAGLAKAQAEGVISPEQQVETELELQKRLDEDLKKSTERNRQNLQENPALERGSKEAFSALNRAKFEGLGSKNPNQKVEENTEKNVTATDGVRKAIEDLSKKLGPPIVFGSR